MHYYGFQYAKYGIMVVQKKKKKRVKVLQIRQKMTVFKWRYNWLTTYDGKQSFKGWKLSVFNHWQYPIIMFVKFLITHSFTKLLINYPENTKELNTTTTAKNNRTPNIKSKLQTITDLTGTWKILYSSEVRTSFKNRKYPIPYTLPWLIYKRGTIKLIDWK